MDRPHPDELIRTCSALRREGRSSDALKFVREAMRRKELDAETTEAAGRFVRKALGGGSVEGDPLRVLLLGQCTLSWTMNALTAVAWGHGVAAIVDEGGFDSVLQDLSGLQRAPDVIVLFPWSQRLLASDERTSQQRVSDELAFWQQAWKMLPAESRLVQVGYDGMGPGALGYQLGSRADGHVQLVRRVNEALRDQLPPSSYYVDLPQVSAQVGRSSFYDPRSYVWTKQPFSLDGVCRVADHLWAGVRAVTTGPSKVLVLDLDNTLWGGVVGELGPLGIQLGESPDGEAFRAFQSLAKDLRERGVVLAVCSKNNSADAREPFEKNPDMVLCLEDFASFEASWDPKPVAIQRIAETLRLGVDSFVFFDDNPVEREHVRQALPTVAVVEVPEEPAEYGKALLEGLWFESAMLTSADQERAEQYRAEADRSEVQRGAGSLEEYLASLDMVASFRPLCAEDMQRVVQLLGKTNQFNLTTRRHSHEQVLQITAGDRAVGLTVRLRDRFGDYGLIAVVLGQALEAAERSMLRLDTWLMSCRVIGRTVEDCILNEIASAARDRGYDSVLGEFTATKKNALVADLFPRLGFEPLEKTDSADAAGSTQRYRLDLSKFQPRPTFVRCLT